MAKVSERLMGKATVTAREPPRPADRADIVKTRSAFFAAEALARTAIEKYEQAKGRYVAACERAGVMVHFDDD